MLWEEMEKYTKLTGEDATHVPIMKLGAYLDGYEKGIEVLDKIRVEIEDEYEDCVIGKLDDDEMYPCFRRITDIYGVLGVIDKYIDKYKAESEDT